MPELPEVETVRRSLEQKLAGARVTAVQVKRRDVVVMPGDPDGGFSRSRSTAAPKRLRPPLLLQGGAIAEVRRRGKQLAILTEQACVCIHLGMTGQLRILPPRSRERLDHAHVRWTLSSDDPAVGALIFRDPRRFGGVWALQSHASLDERWTKLGPDALAITTNQLSNKLAGSRRAIKAALLDQAVLAGVGNIYADEALFRAGINPADHACGLVHQQIKDLAREIRSVLSEAVRARGSTLRDYTDPDGQPGSQQLQHRVYARSGEPCLTCGSTLLGTVLAQRATVWCPRCQPARS